MTTWETTLAAESAYRGVTGQAAAASGLDGTDVGIGLDGAEPGASYRWGLRIGTCEAPGSQVGPDTDYPDLVTDPTGSAAAETHVGPRMSVGEPYHVDVRDAAADGVRVACGDLHQVYLTGGA